MAITGRAHYKPYLLRLWREADSISDRGMEWRFSLEDSRTGMRVGFANLEKLYEFLSAETQRDETQNDLFPNTAERSE
jgi:hypothetical protein